MGQVAYVGSLGSGKTWAICRAALGLCLTRPGFKFLLGRFYATELRDTTQEEFFLMIAQIEELIAENVTNPDFEKILGVYSASKRNYDFANGSQILFRPLDEAETKYKSLMIGGFGIDEASEVDLAAFNMLTARIRQATKRSSNRFRTVGCMVSNPTDYDHWLYDFFVRKQLPGYTIFRTNTMENLDNLPAGYVANLRRQYSEDWVRRYLEGEWGELQRGRRPVFPSFSQTVHVRDTEWYRTQPILVGIDFGYKSPGVVWAQIDTKQRLQIHRTWGPHEVTAEQLAQGIVKRNEAWFPSGRFSYFAGHDGNTKKDTGEKSAVEILRTYGIQPSIRYTHIDRGLNIIRMLLQERDDLGPGILINPQNQTLIAGFTGAYYYPPITETDLSRGVKDVPHKDDMHDPLFDALRYIVVNAVAHLGWVTTLPIVTTVNRRRDVGRRANIERLFQTYG